MVFLIFVFLSGIITLLNFILLMVYMIPSVARVTRALAVPLHQGAVRLNSGLMVPMTAAQFFPRPVGPLGSCSVVLPAIPVTTGPLPDSAGSVAQVARAVLYPGFSTSSPSSTASEEAPAPAVVTNLQPLSAPPVEKTVRQCIERVVELRGVHGWNGLIDQAWVAAIQTEKEEIRFLGHLCGKKVDLQIDPHAPNAVDMLRRCREECLQGKTEEQALAACKENDRASYLRLQRQTREKQADKKALDEEYEDLGGSGFNPDKNYDRETGLFVVQEGSQIDRAQKNNYQLPTALLGLGAFSLPEARTEALSVPAEEELSPEMDLEQCIQRVRVLRGKHGWDGLIDKAWVDGIEAERKQLRILSEICRGLGIETANPPSLDARHPEVQKVFQQYREACLNGQNVDDVFSRATGKGLGALVNNYRGLELEKNRKMEEKKKLHEEYVSYGGVSFNPDVRDAHDSYIIERGSLIALLSVD